MCPPPPPGDAVRDYLAVMYHQAAEANAEAEERRRLRNEIERKKLELELAQLNSGGNPVTRSLDSYEQQITEWFNRLPPEARKAPRTMEEFLNLLIGRTSGMRAHPGEVARVLRRLGWGRQRRWKVDGEGRRVWVPPYQ